ncbi:MAG: hypothetical protein KA340_12970, partial [Saprospiraceae bacterium]|nr:hypothetical protein [Saprospiraceae bacterium]
MSLTTEKTFETALVQHLVENGGYAQGDAGHYNPDYGLFVPEVLAFLQSSQPQKWEKITGIHGAEVENRVIQRLIKELDL